MIKHTEVRIGNLVKYEDRVFKINVISEELPGLDTEEYGIGVVTWKGLDPILINEEWLDRFGFKSVVKEGNQKEFIVYSKNEITYNTSHGWWLRHRLIVQPKHIHELQNLYWSLCNEELTIKT